MGGVVQNRDCCAGGSASMDPHVRRKSGRLGNLWLEK